MTGRPASDVLADPEALAHRAAAEVVRCAHDAVARRGRFAWVLAGGNTPKALYRLLHTAPYAAQMPWAATDLFFGDERYVPHDHALSNCRMVRETLIDPLRPPLPRLYPIPTAATNPAHDAARYARLLAERLPPGPGPTAVPQADLVLLGMGNDGHVASLFPASPALAEPQALALAVEAKAIPPTRITLTFPFFLGAARILLLVEGTGKADAVRAVFEHTADLPASRFAAGDPRVLWLLDREAAAWLDPLAP